MTSVLHDAGIGVERGYLCGPPPLCPADGDDAEAPMAQVELRVPTAISTSVSTAVRLLDGQNSVVLGSLDSSNSPMNTPITR